jgi:hypothetical protein
MRRRRGRRFGDQLQRERRVNRRLLPRLEIRESLDVVVEPRADFVHRGFHVLIVSRGSYLVARGSYLVARGS